MTTSRSGPACVSSQRTIAITTSLSGGPFSTSTEKISRWPNNRDFTEQIWSINGHDVLFLIWSVGHPMNEKMKEIYSNLPRSNCKQKCSGFSPPKWIAERTSVCQEMLWWLTPIQKGKEKPYCLFTLSVIFVCIMHCWIWRQFTLSMFKKKKKILKSLQQ